MISMMRTKRSDMDDDVGDDDHKKRLDTLTRARWVAAAAFWPPLQAAIACRQHDHRHNHDHCLIANIDFRSQALYLNWIPNLWGCWHLVDYNRTTSTTTDPDPARVQRDVSVHLSALSAISYQLYQLKKILLTIFPLVRQYWGTGFIGRGGVWEVVVSNPRRQE